ncbi:MAG TPA: bifunctional hydroxymethylpyrimidine kinase/phosphomethylpyrimidine kinase [Acidimicrobiales bacterium]|nr:bifunctional hydroxymethylpyrimidine kinase/phosphomethylpyrimidine kinase [Acidimicrobiales bacterium]
MTPPVALTIAGSDSGGAAGIQADLRTFAALGVFGTTAITCTTAQNSIEVRAVNALPGALVRQQVEAVLDDLPVRGAKTGLLPSEEIVREVASLSHRLPPLVVDPVLVATSGARLADDATMVACLRHLFPVAAVVTPNVAEAAVLLGRELSTLEDAREAARRLGEHTAVVVVKGGHLSQLPVSVDVVWDGQESWEISRPRIATGNTHGSGCTFSAAVAAGLAQGMAVRESVERANEFVHAALEGSAGWHLGAGAGPLDHFGWKDGP